jgi:hypothetical protein
LLAPPTISVVSAADNSFLALSYIGTGEKYGDMPDFIHAAFESFSMPPSIIDTIILPKPLISVLALVAYNLPTESLVKPLPDPCSYFTKEDPDPTDSASIQLLKSLPILPLIVLEKNHLAGQSGMARWVQINYLCPHQP